MKRGGGTRLRRICGVVGTQISNPRLFHSWDSAERGKEKDVYEFVLSCFSSVFNLDLDVLGFLGVGFWESAAGDVVTGFEIQSKGVGKVLSGRMVIWAGCWMREMACNRAQH